MTVKSLVAAYEKGAIVANEVVVRCLLMIDPVDPALVLHGLPDQILSRMPEFIHQYQPGRMVSNHPGPLPTVDQVEAARRWLEGASKLESASTS